MYMYVACAYCQTGPFSFIKVIEVFILLQAVNKAMQKDKDELVCGVLDIYGFEIFMVSSF